MMFTPLSAPLPGDSFFSVLEAPLHYEPRLDEFANTLHNNTFAGLSRERVDLLLQQYSDSVNKYNDLRALQSDPSQTNAHPDIDGQVDDAWSSIILHELFIQSLGTHQKPLALTQYLMPRQFKNGKAFEDSLTRASIQPEKEGWVAAVYDDKSDRIIVGFIPNNEM
ncbi:hypothetical protein BLNAU_13413 [Blattamonas nauphoetae]|uniref:Uncharacterized protein n=1 Tax=Blattamonas nauphoetae TaxID=2049346 RepID=A0ABQ9XJL2_9EUKA|nr:hypothetical protein BLNAU_13413 [Blattamonas nauphoetae]